MDGAVEIDTDRPADLGSSVASPTSVHHTTVARARATTRWMIVATEHT